MNRAITEHAAQYFDSLVRAMDTIGPNEWGLLSIISILIGYLCLRGNTIR